MTKQERSKLARRQLDAKFSEGSLRAVAARPTHGWIRAIRDALGMTSRQLAVRMGQSQSAVTQLEKSEISDGARLDSLRRAAAALDCELVYALVPRRSLDDTVRARARTLARADLGAVNRTMKLEDQGLEAGLLDRRLDDYAEQLLAIGRLWEEDASA